MNIELILGFSTAFNLILLLFVLVREGQNQSILRDLTAKLLAKDVDDYRKIAEHLPFIEKKVETKKQKFNDSTLGSQY